MLERVTITGADDGVDPKALADLSAEFPFAEWGILFSSSRTGTARYPSAAWVQRLVGECWRRPRMKMSAHLCGEIARETMAGSERWLDTIHAPFGRVQLNGFSESTQELVTLIHRAADVEEFILQARNLHGLAEAVQVAGRVFTSAPRVTALWDVSGGRGLAPLFWPNAPTIPGECAMPIGFAGGINPDNVESVLRAIGERDVPFWIDLETGVRTQDTFDLALVRIVLTLARPFIAKARG